MERITQLESILQAIHSGQVDLILGKDYPLIIKAKSIEDEMKKLTTALEQTSDWVLITDINGSIEYVNKAVERISGYGRDELIGKNPRIFKSGRHEKDFYKNLWDSILSGSPFSTIIIDRKKTGELFELHYTITPVKDDNGNIKHFVATAKDLTERKLLQEHLEYYINRDILTGLYNRDFFTKEINSLSTNENRSFAVVIADIDKFTLLNDTFGYETGDEILKKVGKTIVDSVCKDCIVSRFEADKFAVLIKDVKNPEEIILELEVLRNNFKKPFLINNEEFLITLSMGIAIFPENGKSADILIKNAEVALSNAREDKLNNYQFFNEEINIKTSKFITMQRHLYHALEKNEFVMHYQPYFDCDTRAIVGIEALLRWNSPKFGITLPGHFIPFLEETGMILEVGKWVIKNVCMQISDWIRKGYKTRLVPVFINLSMIQFLQKDLINFIENTIANTGIYPSLLGFEITESTLNKDISYTINVIEKLKQLGITVNIDDFGTGYSSLSILRSLPINSLKIDRSFVKNIAINPDDATIVITIISMAHHLNLKTIAEGVETEEQWKILRILRCDMAQGYYFAKPLTAEEIMELLKGSSLAI